VSQRKKKNEKLSQWSKRTDFRDETPKRQRGPSSSSSREPEEKKREGRKEKVGVIVCGGEQIREGRSWMKEFIRRKKVQGSQSREEGRKLLVGRELENGADNVSVGLLEGGDGLGAVDLALIDDDLDVVLSETGKGLVVSSGGRGRRRGGGRRGGSILNLDKIWVFFFFDEGQRDTRVS
jgi:hypothetical protein